MTPPLSLIKFPVIRGIKNMYDRWKGMRIITYKLNAVYGSKIAVDP